MACLPVPHRRWHLVADVTFSQYTSYVVFHINNHDEFRIAAAATRVFQFGEDLVEESEELGEERIGLGVFDLSVVIASTSVVFIDKGASKTY
jgi:hypothetical protein